MPTMKHHRRTAHSRRRSAFTIAEMIVAIAVVALLTVAIGEVFRSVTRLTTLGGAVAETDGLARAIERSLRADFDALNRLNPDETFLVIRMREVGDLNRNGAVGGDAEVALYLTDEDRLWDREQGLNPYATSAGGERRSRAVTRRVDEIAFLGRAPDDQPYRSSQVDPSGAVPVVTARHARLYWGHALRPAPDPGFNPGPTTDPLERPRRQFRPDGNIGSELNWGRAFGVPNTGGVLSRNQFASDWILARHQLLLYGGLAAGNLGVTNPDAPHPIGGDRFFAPYIRDREATSTARFPTNQVGPLNDPPGPIHNSEDLPDPRFIRHGRVDISAQSLEDVRRWLEGESDHDESNVFPFADAYAAGRFSGAGFEAKNAPLWVREFETGVLATRRANAAHLRGALAGVLTRILQDDTSGHLDRGVLSAPDTPEQEALMDLHAAIATRCSNFEVAWSDGSTVRRQFERDDKVYKPGDLLWFDISPVEDEPSNNPPRNTYFEWWAWNNSQSEPAIEFRSGFPGQNLASPTLPIRPEFPEITFDAMGSPNFIRAGLNEGEYPRVLSGGAPTVTSEAMAIWGFRVPDAEGGFSGAWQKPRFIRIRVTLHDSRMRLREGRDYEFVFAVHPDRNL